MSLVKICGLSSESTLEAAIGAGADMIGLVRFARSPRHVDLDRAAALADQARGRSLVTLLVVDPEDTALDEAVRAIAPDLVQLHGYETPQRAAAIRERYAIPVMKALGIAEPADLAALAAYAGVDRILLDAKPPKNANLPGGNGLAFDWRILAAPNAAEPKVAIGLDRGRLMLSGGLTPENVAVAIRTTGLRGVDVSSGVERGPGEKDVRLIRAFVAAARAAFDETARTGTTR